MNRHTICELTDCSLFRQTLQTRPPAIVHGTAILLMLLLVGAAIWAALVQANLVIKTSGRVRPIEQPTRVFTSATPRLEGRVAEVNFAEGDQVRQGQVLLRLDTKPLDNEIAKLVRQIDSAEEELGEIARLDVLLAEQLQSAQAKAQAELSEAEARLQRARQEQVSKIRQAQSELAAANDRLARYRQAYRNKAITQQQYVEVATQVRQADEALKQAQLPLDEGRLHVLRRALELVDRDFTVRRAELESRRVVKRGEVDAARKELANLNLALDQAVLRSPLDGVVVSGNIDVGDVLEPGKPAVEIAPQDGFRFEVVVPSGDVGELAVGMPVRIKFDAYDYQNYGTLDGTVCFISPDSRVHNVDEASSGPQQPVGYLVRVELHGDELSRNEWRGQVKLGLGGTAEIVTGQESLLAILLKKIRRTISLS